MIKHFLTAAKKALSTIDKRHYLIGAVGIRKDGAIVHSKNGSVIDTDFCNYKKIPNSHAESRLLLKLGKGGIIFLTRVAKIDNQYAMARPCEICQAKIIANKVKMVYYTIDQNNYGIWIPSKNIDKIYCY